MKKWYEVLKDLGALKKGEKVELAEAEAKGLVDGGVLKEIVEDPAAKIIDDAKKALAEDRQALVTETVKAVVAELTRKDVDGKKRLPHVIVGRDLAEDRDGWESLGDMAKAVKNAALGMGVEEKLVVGVQKHFKMHGIKAPAGMSDLVGAEGGFPIPEQFAANIWERAYQDDDLLTLVDGYTVLGNTYSFPGLSDDNRAVGQRWGGVRGYWMDEAGSYTKSKPSFRKVKLELHKLGVYVVTTDEQMEDSPFALEAWLTRAAGREIRFLVSDAIMNGDGIGKPLGVLNSNALVTITKETSQVADTIVANNLIKMYSRVWVPSLNRGIWLHNQNILPQLLTVNAGGTTTTSGAFPHVLLYMPPGGLSQAPYGNLFGRTCRPCEYSPTLGDKGDIGFFDFAHVVAITKGGVKSAMSIHLYFDTGQQCFRFTFRMDATPWMDKAITPYKGTAATVSPFVVIEARA